MFKILFLIEEFLNFLPRIIGYFIAARKYKISIKLTNTRKQTPVGSKIGSAAAKSDKGL